MSSAQRVHALDVGAGRAGPSGLSLPEPKSRAATTPPKKPSNPYANPTTAASTLIQNVSSGGIAGDWEVLPVTFIPTRENRKRPAEVADDDDDSRA